MDRFFRITKTAKIVSKKNRLDIVNVKNQGKDNENSKRTVECSKTSVLDSTEVKAISAGQVNVGNDSSVCKGTYQHEPSFDQTPVVPNISGQDVTLSDGPDELLLKRKVLSTMQPVVVLTQCDGNACSSQSKEEGAFDTEKQTSDSKQLSECPDKKVAGDSGSTVMDDEGDLLSHFGSMRTTRKHWDDPLPISILSDAETVNYSEFQCHGDTLLEDLNSLSGGDFSHSDCSLDLTDDYFSLVDDTEELLSSSVDSDLSDYRSLPNPIESSVDLKAEQTGVAGVVDLDSSLVQGEALPGTGEKESVIESPKLESVPAVDDEHSEVDIAEQYNGKLGSVTAVDDEQSKVAILGRNDGKIMGISVPGVDGEQLEVTFTEQKDGVGLIEDNGEESKLTENVVIKSGCQDDASVARLAENVSHQNNNLDEYGETQKDEITETKKTLIADRTSIAEDVSDEHGNQAADSDEIHGSKNRQSVKRAKKAKRKFKHVSTFGLPMSKKRKPDISRQQCLEHVDYQSTDSSDNIPRYRCLYCQYTTVWRMFLVNHLKIHTSDKFIVCKACGIVFKNEKSMKKWHLYNSIDHCVCEEESYSEHIITDATESIDLENVDSQCQLFPHWSPGRCESAVKKRRLMGNDDLKPQTLGGPHLCINPLQSYGGILYAPFFDPDRQSELEVYIRMNPDLCGTYQKLTTAPCFSTIEMLEAPDGNEMKIASVGDEGKVIDENSELGDVVAKEKDDTVELMKKSAGILDTAEHSELEDGKVNAVHSEEMQENVETQISTCNESGNICVLDSKSGMNNVEQNTGVDDAVETVGCHGNSGKRIGNQAQDSGSHGNGSRDHNNNNVNNGNVGNNRNGLGGSNSGGNNDRNNDKNNNDGEDKENIPNTNKELLPCLVCLTTFTIKQDLMRHLTKIHRLTNLCQICYFDYSLVRRFANPVSLRNHKLRDHPEDMVKCVCGAMLIDNKMLTTHLKKFRCDQKGSANQDTEMIRCICGKRFGSEELILSHQAKCRKRHRGQTGYQPLTSCLSDTTNSDNSGYHSNNRRTNTDDDNASAGLDNGGRKKRGRRCKQEVSNYAEPERINDHCGQTQTAPVPKQWSKDGNSTTQGSFKPVGGASASSIGNENLPLKKRKIMPYSPYTYDQGNLCPDANGEDLDNLSLFNTSAGMVIANGYFSNAYGQTVNMNQIVWTKDGLPMRTRPYNDGDSEASGDIFFRKNIHASDTNNNTEKTSTSTMNEPMDLNNSRKPLGNNSHAVFDSNNNGNAAPSTSTYGYSATMKTEPEDPYGGRDVKYIPKETYPIPSTSGAALPDPHAVGSRKRKTSIPKHRVPQMPTLSTETSAEETNTSDSSLATKRGKGPASSSRQLSRKKSNDSKKTTANLPKKRGRKKKRADADGKYACKTCRRRYKRPYLYIHQKMVHAKKQWVIVPNAKFKGQRPACTEGSNEKYRCGWCRFISIHWQTMLHHHYSTHTDAELDVIPMVSLPLDASPFFGETSG